MEFTDLYNKLKPIYSTQVERIAIEDSKVEVRNYKFTSTSSLAMPPNGVHEGTQQHCAAAATDSAISENRSFTYPIVFPESGKTYSNAILMFHGLNERNWKKYLPWAYYLAQNTGRPVILFPMSFHINRSPRGWVSPREMQPLLEQRQNIEAQDNSTFANVALSQRISDDPLRFFVSGRQSADDIVSLMQQIKSGNISGLGMNTQVNVFSYSIGVLLAQVLFLANPFGLFTNSKMFIFCGGSYFNSMMGCTRLIMDKDAYTKLRNYYLVDFLGEMGQKSEFSDYFRNDKIGEGFWTMVSPECNSNFFDKRMDELADQVRVITLKKDEVIPSSGIQVAFSKLMGKIRGIVQELDFRHEYRHEMPFPIFNNEMSKLVDQSFLQVFRPAVDFLR